MIQIHLMLRPILTLGLIVISGLPGDRSSDSCPMGAESCETVLATLLTCHASRLDPGSRLPGERAAVPFLLCTMPPFPFNLGRFRTLISQYYVPSFGTGLDMFTLQKHRARNELAAPQRRPSATGVLVQQKQGSRRFMRDHGHFVRSYPYFTPRFPCCDLRPWSFALGGVRLRWAKNGVFVRRLHTGRRF